MTPLCDICQTIPFRSLQENPNQKLSGIPLGLYGDKIQRSTCKFCSLISESLELTAVAFGGKHVYLRILRGQKISLDWCETEHCFSVLHLFFKFYYTSGACNILSRVVQSTPVDTSVLVSLLTDCDDCHRCVLPISVHNAQKLTNLRAINVHKMCITSIAPSERYAALSYVWGNVSIPFLLQAKKDEWMRPRGLDRIYAKIPLTIRDAIEFVRRIGLEYLWVDALCLVQDDPEDMAIGIEAMGLLYEHSFFTIVAAQGCDADAGLAGVGPRKNTQVKAEILPGVTLVANGVTGIGGDCGEYIELATYYGTRAWTFQEYQLSRRKFIFANNTVIYQCMKSLWLEDLEDRRASLKLLSTAHSTGHEGSSFASYTEILVRYCDRRATYASDMVNGIVGFYERVVGRNYGGHVFGMPVVAFDWFMCFFVEVERPGFYLERQKPMPSWTWAGWKGRRNWVSEKATDNEILTWTSERTWIIWYQRQSASPPRLIWERFGSDEKHPTISPEKIVNDRLIKFWTFSATFSLHVDQEVEERSKTDPFFSHHMTLGVRDQDGRFWGMVYVDEKFSKRDYEVAELIVISTHEKMWDEDWPSPTCPSHEYKLHRQENGRWHNVLFVEEKSGIAERKGFGQLWLSPIKLTAGSPWKWKEIILG